MLQSKNKNLMRTKVRSEPGERREVETVAREEKKKKRPLELLQQTSQGKNDVVVCLGSINNRSEPEENQNKNTTLEMSPCLAMRRRGDTKPKALAGGHIGTFCVFFFVCLFVISVM